MKCCKVPSCNYKIFKNDYCVNHYQQIRTFGCILIHKIKNKYVPKNNKKIKYKKCTIHNCNNKQLAKGYCSTHYNLIIRDVNIDLDVDKDNYTSIDNLSEIELHNAITEYNFYLSTLHTHRNKKNIS